MAPARLIVPYILITAFQYFLAKDALGSRLPLRLRRHDHPPHLASPSSRSTGGSGRPQQRNAPLLRHLLDERCLLALRAELHLSPPVCDNLVHHAPLRDPPRRLGPERARLARSRSTARSSVSRGIVLFNVPLLSGSSTTPGRRPHALGRLLLGPLLGADAEAEDPEHRPDAGHGLVLQLPALRGLLAHGLHLRPSADLAIDVTFLGLVSGALNFYIWMALVKVEKVGKLTTLIFLAPIITLIYSVATTGVIPSYITLAGWS